MTKPDSREWVYRPRRDPSPPALGALVICLALGVLLGIFAPGFLAGRAW